jgi:hypothetical protein
LFGSKSGLGVRQQKADYERIPPLADGLMSARELPQYIPLRMSNNQGWILPDDRHDIGRGSTFPAQPDIYWENSQRRATTLEETLAALSRRKSMTPFFEVGASGFTDWHIYLHICNLRATLRSGSLIHQNACPRQSQPQLPLPMAITAECSRWQSFGGQSMFLSCDQPPYHTTDIANTHLHCGSSQ